jgi:hypothetical protein
MDLQDIRYQGVELIHVDQDRNWWWDFVNTVMNSRVPKQAENFLTSWSTTSFTNTLLHEVTSLYYYYYYYYYYYLYSHVISYNLFAVILLYLLFCLLLCCICNWPSGCWCSTLIMKNWIIIIIIIIIIILRGNDSWNTKDTSTCNVS